ncbi:MAG: YkuS family protein [Bacillota bacterium]
MERGRIVAVAEGLTPVTEELRSRGYEPVQLGDDLSAVGDVAALVITGLDSNMMGVEDILTEKPVITARGRTAREVADEVDSRTGRE